MMLPSHLLATLLACALVSLKHPLAPREWILALAFGVAIDLDHLLQIPTYLATHSWQDMTPAAISAWGSDWQGILHTPWALLLVLPTAFILGTWTPLAAWALHMILDFVVARHLVRFGGPLEWTIIATMTAALAALALRDHRLHGAHTGLREHLLARAGMIWPR